MTRAGMRDDDDMAPSRRLRRHDFAAVALALVVTVSGCGSAAEQSPPSGVDGLVIPTPSPQASDFVAQVDNPWFPLVIGSRWEYDAPTVPGARVVMEALAGPVIAGVATTGLRSSSAQGVTVQDFYAQDRAGNVWWFGREGAWQAGVGGAEAGLAMPATPRLGDGFAQGGLPGRASRALVVGVEVGPPAILESYGPLVVLEVRGGATSTEASYARGVGLVENDSARLVRYDETR